MSCWLIPGIVTVTMSGPPAHVVLTEGLKISTSQPITPITWPASACDIALLKVVGHMKFVRNVLIKPDEFDSLFDKHRVTQHQLDATRDAGTGTGNQFPILGWEFEDVVIQSTPLW